MPTTRRGKGVVEPLLDVLDELALELKLQPTGPSLSDSIYTKLLAHFVHGLPKEREARAQAIRVYVEKNQPQKEWLAQQLKNSKGRENLKALLRFELNRLA